eukprot:636427-Rhodomonas_salina.2
MWSTERERRQRQRQRAERWDGCQLTSKQSMAESICLHQRKLRLRGKACDAGGGRAGARAGMVRQATR